MKDFEAHLTEETTATIYCDLDGVLVDLIGGLSDLYNIPDLNDANFDVHLKRIKDDLDKNHPNLFATLPWKSDGKKLWAFIAKYNASILSSAPRTWLPNAMIDKNKWVSKNLSPRPRETVIVRGSDQKQKYAVKNGVPNILIDDYDANITQWRAAGGIAIHHKTADESIRQLKKIMRP